MIKVKFNNEKLKEIHVQAKVENRTVLGIIYSDYIGIHLPLVETLNPKNIYCTANFISTILELDKELIGEKAREIYFQYAPSIFKFKTFTLEEDEVIAIVWQTFLFKNLTFNICLLIISVTTK